MDQKEMWRVSIERVSTNELDLGNKGSTKQGLPKQNIKIQTSYLQSSPTPNDFSFT